MFLDLTDAQYKGCSAMGAAYMDTSLICVQMWLQHLYKLIRQWYKSDNVSHKETRVSLMTTGYYWIHAQLSVASKMLAPFMISRHVVQRRKCVFTPMVDTKITIRL